MGVWVKRQQKQRRVSLEQSSIIIESRLIESLPGPWLSRKANIVVQSSSALVAAPVAIRLENVAIEINPPP